VTYEYDEFSKTGTYITPMFDSNDSIIFLRAVKSEKLQIVTYQVVALIYSRNWGFYEYAIDKEDNSFDLRLMGKKVISGNLFKEIVGIELTRKYLEDHANTGMTFKIYGKKGDKIISVPTIYIGGLLNKTINKGS